MPRGVDDEYYHPPGTEAVPNTLARSSHVNQRFDALKADANQPRPVKMGGTGASTAAAARTNLGAAPLNSPSFTGSPKIDAVNGSLIFDVDDVFRVFAFIRRAGAAIVQFTTRADGKINIVGGPLYVDGSATITEAANISRLPGDLGSYVFCRNSSTTAIGMGTTIQGSQLSPAGIGASGVINVGGGAVLAGTWRCHGYCSPNHITLFQRIA